MCTQLQSYQIQIFITSSRKSTCPFCVTLRKDLPLLCIDGEFDILASTNQRLQKNMMDLQREKSERRLYSLSNNLTRKKILTVV